MANVLSLALRVTADASGLKLDPVQRALVGLGDQAEKLTKQFEQFTGGSEAAAKAQANFDKQAQDLINTLRDGGSATEFAAGFERLTEAVTKEAAAFERAARITEANLSPLERFDRAQAELNEQVQAGRISLETYNRATESAAKGLTDAERAARGLAVQQKAIDNAAENTTLKFNELSGIFSVLPGPLGNIAGRISGISSASEGLSRVFAGGLRTGFANIASAATSLVNPLTAAAVGIGAFAAAASAVIATLNRVSDEVERLSLLADRAGVSFEFIQVLEVAAVKSGTSVDNLSGSFSRFLRSVDDARTGSKGAESAFASLGISIDDLSSQNPERLFTQAARAISQIEDPATRAATAMEIFGKAGTELLPVFEELATAREDLERLGTAISERQKQNLLEYNNELDRLGIASKGAGNQLASAFAPALADVTRALNEGIGAANRFSQKYPVVSEAIADSIVSQIPAIGTLKAIGDALGFVTDSAERAQQVASIEKQIEARKALAEEEQAALEAQQKIVDSIVLDLSKGIDESAKFGQAGFDAALKYQNSIGELRNQLSRGIINDEAFRREAKKASDAFNTELDVVKDAAKEVEAITRRVDGLLAKANEIPQIEQEINAVEAEIARVEAAQEAARATGRIAEADALAARLSKLDQLQASFREQQDQAAQGFEQGFDSAFANVDRGIGSLIEKASEFGQEGFDAALQLQEGIEKAKQQVRDGILSKDVFEKETERQKKLFEQRVAQIKDLEKLNEEIFKTQAALDDRKFELSLERAQELANVRTGSVEINDIRSGGISAFFDALQEDPAIAEAKKQTKELEKMRKELAKLQAEKVDILAGTG